jgi:AcrR family transcriptional regulator
MPALGEVPVPQQRFERLDPARQEAILAAAAGEFAERGYEAASTNRIARAAGTSKGALYYYFEDKADLFGTVLERALARVLEEVEWPQSLAAFTAENYWEMVRSVTRRSLAAMERDTWYMRVMVLFYRLADEPAARGVTTRMVERSRELGRSFLARGLELGVIRADLPLDLLLEIQMAADMAGDRWIVAHWPQLTGQEKEQLMLARFNLMEDMLSAKPKGRES